eukprot:jgi/Mesen1/8880/ME000532S08275
MHLNWSPAAKAARKRRKVVTHLPAAFDETAAGGSDELNFSFAAADGAKGARTEQDNFEDLSAEVDKLLQDGNQLAEAGGFAAALSRWETALAMAPRHAILHEQKAQLLMETGSSWAAVQAATRATELKPEWADAWLTLARAQLNYGEPGLALESARAALLLQPGSAEIQGELQRAQRHAQRQRQVEAAGVADTARLAAWAGVPPAAGGGLALRRAVVRDPMAAHPPAVPSPSLLEASTEVSGEAPAEPSGSLSASPAAPACEQGSPSALPADTDPPVQ